MRNAELHALFLGIPSTLQPQETISPIRPQADAIAPETVNICMGSILGGNLSLRFEHTHLLDFRIGLGMEAGVACQKEFGVQGQEETTYSL